MRRSLRAAANRLGLSVRAQVVNNSGSADLWLFATGAVVNGGRWRPAFERRHGTFVPVSSETQMAAAMKGWRSRRESFCRRHPPFSRSRRWRRRKHSHNLPVQSEFPSADTVCDVVAFVQRLDDFPDPVGEQYLNVRAVLGESSHEVVDGRRPLSAPRSFYVGLHAFEDVVSTPELDVEYSILLSS